MKTDYVIVKFENVSLKTRQGVKLRGFFANSYKNEELMHNHRGEELILKYPKVQYKVIENIPIICAVQDGASLLAKVGFETDKINIDGKELEVFQKQITKNIVDFGVTGDYIKYRFLTPWVALNQKNIEQYRKSNGIEKEELLKRILTGNIISMAKGLNYTVDNKISVWIDVESVNVNFKNIEMLAFIGSFKVNFEIPDYLGLGKSVSRGFGTIMRVKEGAFK